MTREQYEKLKEWVRYCTIPAQYRTVQGAKETEKELDKLMGFEE